MLSFSFYLRADGDLCFAAADANFFTAPKALFYFWKILKPGSFTSRPH